MKMQEKKLAAALAKMRRAYKKSQSDADKSKVNNLRWRLWELRRAA
jgi:hypothetical protein